MYHNVVMTMVCGVEKCGLLCGMVVLYDTTRPYAYHCATPCSAGTILGYAILRSAMLYHTRDGNLRFQQDERHHVRAVVGDASRGVAWYSICQ